MKDFTFLCIEDHQYFIEQLEEKVINYFKERGYRVQFLSYTDIPDHIDIKKIDACFVDIVINDHNTLDWLKNVGCYQYQTPIIPITNYDNYMADVIHFHIFDFIKKREFDKVIEHTLYQLLKYLTTVNEIFSISYGGETYKLRINDILYIETKSHYTLIHCIDNKDYEIWKSYDHVFTQDFPSLVRIHRSYVMNIHKCDKIKKNEAYIIGVPDPISISKKYCDSVKTEFRKILMPAR